MNKTGLLIMLLALLGNSMQAQNKIIRDSRKQRKAITLCNSPPARN